MNRADSASTLFTTGRRPFRCLSAALTLAALAAPAPAAAQPAPTTPPPAPSPAAPQPPKPLADVLTGAAKAEYMAGRILFEEGDYANAIIKFERAYELSREPRLLENVALCQLKLKRYTQMRGTVQRLLTSAGSQASPQTQQLATQLLDAIKPYVSELEIQGGEPGAAVFIDDVEVGTLPFSEPVLVDVGPRKFRVSKKGFKDFTETREVVGGGTVTLSARLERELHRGRLVVRAGPQDLIYLDGRMIGRGTWEGSVPSGGHTLRVTAPGKVAEQREVMLQDDQVRRVDVQLKDIQKDSTATWLWIGGGAALLAGAVVAGIFLFQPEPPVEGNTSPGVVAVSGRERGLVLRFGGSR